MSLDRIKGRIVFICDTCDETLETGTNDIPQALNLMSAAAWQARRKNGDWEHFCSEACSLGFD